MNEQFLSSSCGRQQDFSSPLAGGKFLDWGNHFGGGGKKGKKVKVGRHTSFPLPPQCPLWSGSRKGQEKSHGKCMQEGWTEERKKGKDGRNEPRKKEQDYRQKRKRERELVFSTLPQDSTRVKVLPTNLPLLWSVGNKVSLLPDRPRASKSKEEHPRAARPQTNRRSHLDKGA